MNVTKVSSFKPFLLFLRRSNLTGVRENHIHLYKEVATGDFYKRGVLKNFAKFSGKRLCRSLCFNKVAGLMDATLLKKENATHVFSYEFCETFKNTFLTEHH